jgi:hypothetical protein
VHIDGDVPNGNIACCVGWPLLIMAIVRHPGSPP